MLTIRREKVEDIPAIANVVRKAFGSDGESKLVDELRESDALLCSLVAKENNDIVAHLAISPVTITGEKGVIQAAGLGPMAVLPSHQNQGVGTRLLSCYLEKFATPSDLVLVVLGHPEFYSRFGFKPARPEGITCEYDVPDEVFMVLALKEGALAEIDGLVKYHEAFNAV